MCVPFMCVPSVVLSALVFKLTGTFLLNAEKERVAARLAERTVSLWTFLEQPANKATFLNRFYRPVQGVLPISSDLRSVNLQLGLYAPWLVPTALQTELRYNGADPTVAELTAELERYGGTSGLRRRRLCEGLTRLGGTWGRGGAPGCRLQAQIAAVTAASTTVSSA